MSAETSRGGAWRRRTQTLTTPRGLFITTALLLCALPVTKDIRDPDFWWHLRTGQLIVDHRGLLGTDPFTYTASTHHWTMHEWLTEVLFAGLYRVGGLALIVVVLSVVTWLALLCIFRSAQLRHPHHLALGLGLVVAVITGSPVWGPRAQMITFAFTCLVLFLVERHLRQGGRLIWTLVPLFLVWSNLHSGFIIGAGFIVLIIGAEVVGRRLGLPGTAPPDRVRSLVMTLIACGAVVAINPNGLEIYLYPFQTQGSAAQQSLIQEWQSPDFHDASVWAFEFMMLSLAIMLVINRRVAPRDLVLALTTVALSLQSERHIALFVAASTPLWIEQANLCGQRLWSRRRAVHTVHPRPSPRPPRFAWLLSFTVIAGLGLFVLAWLANAASTREDSLTYARDYPVCAARWLAASPSGLHIFDQYGEGGYLASRLSAHGDKVFIFGDAALMGDDLLNQYGAVEGVTPQWDRILVDSGTDLVLFDAGTSFSNMLTQSQRWIEVYRDPRSVAFIPATDTGRALAARLAPVPHYAADSTDTCAQLQRGGLSS